MLLKAVQLVECAAVRRTVVAHLRTCGDLVRKH